MDMNLALTVLSILYFFGVISLLYESIQIKSLKQEMMYFTSYFLFTGIGFLFLIHQDMMTSILSRTLFSTFISLGAIAFIKGVTKLKRIAISNRLLAFSFFGVVLFIIVLEILFSEYELYTIVCCVYSSLLFGYALYLKTRHLGSIKELNFFDTTILLFLLFNISRVTLVILKNTNATYDWTSFDLISTTGSGLIGFLMILGINTLINEHVFQAFENEVSMFTKTIDLAPVPIMIHGEDGTVVNISNTWTELTGYTHQDIPTIHEWTRHAYGEEMTNVKEFIEQLYHLQKRNHDGIYNVRTKTGEVLNWDFYSAYIGDNSDGVKLVKSVALDVTKTIHHQQEHERMLEEIKRTKILLEASLDSPRNMIILSLDRDYKYLLFNKEHKRQMEQIYGIEVKEGLCILDLLTVEEDRNKAKKYYDIALNGTSHSTIDVYGENQDLYYEAYYNPIYNEQNEIIGVSVFGSNITQRRESELLIKESEEQFRLLYSSMSQGLAIHELIRNEEGDVIDYSYLDINDSYEHIFGIKRNDVIGKSMKEAFPKLEAYWYNNFFQVVIDNIPRYFENYSGSVDKYLSTYAYPLKNDRFAVLITDITERVKRDREIKFLSYHDQLTGVGNRRSYEEHINRLNTPDNLPLSLILGDVNGLKLVNDSFGHLVGDELLILVANILKQACREEDVICRIGGDEFIIILPKTKQDIAQKVVKRINDLAKDKTVDNIDVSISFGTGTKTDPSTDILDLFRDIEDDMYKTKMNETKSMRSKTVDLIMTTLYEKNSREMEHSKRVADFCSKLAKAAGQSAEFIKQIHTAGLMHDIGKIGVDSKILDKEGPLNPNEWDSVKKHSEIGYRILNSITEFSDIATYVLEHHEHWNGSGYPNGLSGHDISLQGRIIKICDAYDAMTAARPYRNTRTNEDAVEELQKYAGVQFDPELTTIFIEQVLQVQ